MEGAYPAMVLTVAFDSGLAGYRVRFRVGGPFRLGQWFTVRTDPPRHVRRTRWRGREVELVLDDAPAWTPGQAVTLTLSPFA